MGSDAASIWKLLEPIDLFDAYEEAAHDHSLVIQGDILDGLRHGDVYHRLPEVYQRWVDATERVLAEGRAWWAALTAFPHPAANRVAAQVAGLLSRVEQAKLMNQPASLGAAWADARAELHALPNKVLGNHVSKTNADATIPSQVEDSSKTEQTGSLVEEHGKRPGRPADPRKAEIVARLRQLRDEGTIWRDIPTIIKKEFGRELTSETLRGYMKAG